MADDFVITDLRKNYSTELLHSFYQDCILPSFSMFKDELEEESHWQKGLLTPDQECRFLLHIIIVADKKDPEKVLGGCVFEYYKESNCTLYTYAVASAEARGKGFARPVFEFIFDIINGDAQKCMQ